MSQRGTSGRRRRYFLAKQLARERDGRLPRIRYSLNVRVGLHHCACWHSVSGLHLHDAGTLCISWGSILARTCLVR